MYLLLNLLPAPSVMVIAENAGGRLLMLPALLGGEGPLMLLLFTVPATAPGTGVDVCITGLLLAVELVTTVDAGAAAATGGAASLLAVARAVAACSTGIANGLL